MIQLHHLKNSRSQRIIWLLEELGLAYDVIQHTRPKKTSESSGSLQTIHPLGKVPILCDDGVVMAETAAICEYVLQRYAQGVLQPSTESAEWLLYTYWRYFAESSLMPYLAMKLVFGQIERRAPWPFKLAVIPICRVVGKMYLHPNIYAELNYIEAHLKQHTWFAGAYFTTADILMSFPIEAMLGRLIQEAQYPHIAAFVQRIHARPAYQRARLRGEWSESEFEYYWSCII